MFKSIVVGIDASETAREALERAVALAVGLRAALQVVSAYEPRAEPRIGIEATPVGDADWSLGPHGEVVSLLQQAEAQARAAGLSEVHTHPRQGDAADAIIDVAEEQRADLIVVGNKGMSGARRFLLGSVPARVSQHAPCSVLIVRTS